jgi:rfaE bifunctional protein nucleotidyltransferase chain/domain
MKSADRRISAAPRFSGPTVDFKAAAASARERPGGETADYRRKILDIDTLVRKIGGLRAAPPDGSSAKTVVHCHGCFDIVHPGHIRYLQFARTQGDILVVSITGDDSIDKGQMRPYIPQELRAENLAALEFVDFVVIDPHPTARELLSALKPDIYVKGQEYAASTDPRFLAERRVVESYGGRVIFSSGQVVFSSTRLVDALSTSPDLPGERLAAVCRRHGIGQRSLRALIHEMQGRRVLVLGDSFVERYVLCDADGIAHEAPMMSLTELAAEDYLGGAASIAVQAAALGADTVLITGMGTGPLSAWTEQTLTSLGVHVLGGGLRDELPLNTRYLADDRKLFKTHRGAAMPLDSVAERKVDGLLRDLMGESDALIGHDCGYGLITPALGRTLARQDSRRAGVVSWSANQPWGDLAGVPGCDLVCCSERRLRGASGNVDAGLSTRAYDLLQKTQAMHMLVTLGKRGLVTFDRRSHVPQTPGWHDRLRSEYLPSLANRVLDRLGVSEAVVTIASLALAMGGSLMQAAYLATAVAAMRIAAVGPVPVTAEELLQWLSTRPELAERPRLTTVLTSPTTQVPHYAAQPM